jgi:hypothetical protein
VAELWRMIREAIQEGKPLHVTFKTDAGEWILSMSRREDRV